MEITVRIEANKILGICTQYGGVQYTEQYSTVVYSKVQWYTVNYSTVLYSTVQCSAFQYITVQYSTVQCSTVQYSKYNTPQFSLVEYN